MPESAYLPTVNMKFSENRLECLLGTLWVQIVVTMPELG